MYAKNGTSRRPLWLDSWAYAQRLLLQGRPIPWFEPTAFDGFFRKSDQLLDADSVILPFRRLLRAHVESDPELSREMASKRRLVFPLKVLLRDELLRARVAECCGLIAQAMPRKPLVAAMPSPRELVGWAYSTAHDGSVPEVTVDTADSGSMVLSDFLSALGQCPISAVMVEEGADRLGEYLPAYSSLRNVCSHQRWGLGIRCESLDALEVPFDFVITQEIRGDSGHHTMRGLWLKDDIWADDSVIEAANAAFYYAQIPADAQPERVLERRETLRAA